MLLAEETLKILLAVISISFLVYFLTSLYFAKVGEKERQQAEATMERVKEIIKNVALESEDVSDVTPVGWSFFGFVNEEAKPNSCAGKNCLCLCDDVFEVTSTRQVNECDKKGVCEIVNNLENFEEIKIKQSPFMLEIKKEGGMIAIQEK